MYKHPLVRGELDNRPFTSTVPHKAVMLGSVWDTTVYAHTLHVRPDSSQLELHDGVTTVQ